MFKTAAALVTWYDAKGSRLGWFELGKRKDGQQMTLAYAQRIIADEMTRPPDGTVRVVVDMALA